MTVRRHAQVEFPFPLHQVKDMAAIVLAGKGDGYRYHKTSYDPAQQTFHTTIRPTLYPLVLSTSLGVTLQQQGQGTLVVSQVTSQRLIMGDVFDYYNKYLAEFISLLGRELSIRQPQH